MSKTIYGVIHFQKNAERAIEKILPSVHTNSKIGLEVTPRELDLYRSMYTNSIYSSLFPKEMEDRLVTELSKGYIFKNEDWKEYISSKIFWFRLCKAFDEENVNISALGSEKRIRLIDNITMRFNKYEDYPPIYDIVLGPHFDKYLADMIIRGGYDTAVLGVGHASNVAFQAKFELNNINFMPPNLQSWCESAKRTYVTLDEKMRRQLPDLRD